MALYNGTNKPGFPAQRDPLPPGSYSAGSAPMKFLGGPVVLNIPAGLGDRRIVVDKAKERIRFEDETETQVTLVIKPKE